MGIIRAQCEEGEGEKRKEEFADLGMRQNFAINSNKKLTRLLASR